MVTEVLNAHAAAIPTLAVVDAAGVDDENGGLKPGDRVTVTGLRSRPELNAKVAVVLAPEVKGGGVSRSPPSRRRSPSSATVSAPHPPRSTGALPTFCHLGSTRPTIRSVG